MLCEYAMDSNESMLSDNLKSLVWPPSESTSTVFKRMATMTKNMIIVKLSFKTPNVDLAVLDARTTLSDKIANFGGTFGIWAELTGFSLLGIINITILTMKLISNYCRS